MMMVTAEWVMVGLSEELLSEYYSARLPCLLLTHNTCNHYYSIVIIKASGILVKDSLISDDIEGTSDGGARVFGVTKLKQCHIATSTVLTMLLQACF